MKNKFIITFAGVVGSSKIPISYYLSWNLNLPILNNDSMRIEIIEDFGCFNEQEYLKMRDGRIEQMLKKGGSFIYDASVDREWENYRDEIKELGYDVFIISLDLSKSFLQNLYQVKGYEESLGRLDDLLTDHESFLNRHNSDVGVHITDEKFSNRLELSLNAVNKWIKN